MKKHFPGISKLAAGIAASFDPIDADIRRRAEEIKARWKIMEEVVGYPINSERQYEKAAAGAPREVVENDNITADAWLMVAPAHFRDAIDRIRLAEWYTERFRPTIRRATPDPKDFDKIAEVAAQIEKAMQQAGQPITRHIFKAEIDVSKLGL
jgi:hypothetical protein